MELIFSRPPRLFVLCCALSHAVETMPRPSVFAAGLDPDYTFAQDHSGFSNSDSRILRREEHGSTVEVAGAVGSSILYVIYTDSDFYSTRVRYFVETWGASLDESSVVLVSDTMDAVSAAAIRFNIHETNCQAHSHENGACCKYAEAVRIANDVLSNDPDRFKWVYFLDDDSYVRTDALEKKLSTKDHSPALVFANFGCTSACGAGICAGGGYIATPKAVRLMATGNGMTSLLEEQMQHCSECDGWADIALSQIIDDRGIGLRTLPGLYGWMLEKPCFDESLKSERHFEPLMYHYIRTESSFWLLERLFGKSGPLYNKLLVDDGSAQVELGESRCATFKSNTQCSDEEEGPWLPGRTPCAIVFRDEAPEKLAMFLGNLMYNVFGSEGEDRTGSEDEDKDEDRTGVLLEGGEVDQDRKVFAHPTTAGASNATLDFLRHARLRRRR